MTPADVALLTAILVNAVLAGIVFLHSRRRLVESSFAIFAACVGLWALSTYLATSNAVPFDWFRIGMIGHYITGNLVFLSLFWFSIYFPFPSRRKEFALAVTAADAIILVGTVFTPFLFVGFSPTATIAESVTFNQVGYFFISFITIFMFFCSQVILLRKQSGVEVLDKTRVRYIIWGTVTTGSTGLLTNLILPAFGNFSLFFLGPIVTTPFFVGTMMYTILQYKLFNLRVLAAEVFTTLFVVVMALNFFNAKTNADFVIQGFALVTAIIFGFLLIRGVYQEVRNKEQIELLAENLKHANEKLRELDKLKSQFLSIASHDLRAPLTVVRNFISLLLEGAYGKLSAAGEEGLRQVFERATDMAKSVDTYLDVSRIEQGKMKYDFIEVELLPFIKNAVAGFRTNAEKKGLTVRFAAPAELEGIKAKIDVPKMNEVLNNLLDNAIKYTPRGSIDITVEKRDSRARITIHDTGVGMSAETIGKLFQLFSAGENARKVNVSSTGVGLYITKAHVEAHGGRIWAESEGEGKGSRFMVELPILESQKLKKGLPSGTIAEWQKSAY